MEDEKIIELFFARSEEGIARTKEKYGRYCGYIAKNILGDELDAEECVSDAYLRLWKLIPPTRPERLSVFLGKLVRGLSIDRLRKRSAKKRGFSEAELTDEELSEVFATCDDEIESSLISDAINRFLGSLEKKKRIIFVRRYWYMGDIRSISGSLGMSEGSVNMTLSRLRAELKKFLEKEGFEV